MPPAAELPRIAAILTPVSALRGAGCLGIGDTAALKDFIAGAADAGFSIVKLLPINETGGDNSPYNAISSQALEPALLRVDPASIPGLTKEDFDRITSEQQLLGDSDQVDYAAVKNLKRSLLRAAFDHFAPTSCKLTPLQEEFANFELNHESWLAAYTLFRILVDENGSEQWTAWPDEHRSHEGALGWLNSLDLEKRNSVERDRSFYAFIQWQAEAQWRSVKQHAQSLGVELMGDIPFGVNFFSSDVWANPCLFKEGWFGGTPPDKMFTHDRFVQEWGQNWGIPIYNWDAMRRDNFNWWRQRVAGVKAFFHLFRIDHILGFYRIYGFPWRPEDNESFLDLPADDVRNRCGGREPGFQPRPDDSEGNKSANCTDGAAYLRVILEEAGAGNVVGEDLGEVPDYVRPNLQSLGIAGYKVPQWEKKPDGTLIATHDYERLSIATYGTHDHEPLLTYWKHLVASAAEGSDGAASLRSHLDFLDWKEAPPDVLTDELHETFLRVLFAANSWIAVLMVTDVFMRGDRFNIPGVSASENWTRRLHVPTAGLWNDEKAKVVRRLLYDSGRSRSPNGAH